MTRSVVRSPAYVHSHLGTEAMGESRLRAPKPRPSDRTKNGQHNPLSFRVLALQKTARLGRRDEHEAGEPAEIGEGVSPSGLPDFRVRRRLRVSSPIQLRTSRYCTTKAKTAATKEKIYSMRPTGRGASALPRSTQLVKGACVDGLGGARELRRLTLVGC